MTIPKLSSPHPGMGASHILSRCGPVRARAERWEQDPGLATGRGHGGRLGQGRNLPAGAGCPAGPPTARPCGSLCRAAAAGE